jgi:acyl carrier protein
MNDDLSPSLAAHVARSQDTLDRVRRLLVQRLKVALPPEQIDLDAPLFGTGLGLDSVDAVELVIAIETEFGLLLPQGAARPTQFRTVSSLIELVLNPPSVAPTVASTSESR